METEKNNRSMHMIIMIAMHLFPLLLFLILPKFGFSNKLTFAFAIAAMVGVHILMIKGHSHNSRIKYKNNERGGK